MTIADLNVEFLALQVHTVRVDGGKPGSALATSSPFVFFVPFAVFPSFAVADPLRGCPGSS
jgi:hypothetical protein